MHLKNIKSFVQLVVVTSARCRDICIQQVATVWPQFGVMTTWFSSAVLNVNYRLMVSPCQQQRIIALTLKKKNEAKLNLHEKNDLNLCRASRTPSSPNQPAGSGVSRRARKCDLFCETYFSFSSSLNMALILFPSSPGPNYPTIHIYMLK